VGYNLKITDWQAAIALAQFEKLPAFIKKIDYAKKNNSHLTIDSNSNNQVNLIFVEDVFLMIENVILC
jgi:dTDP-4-amino-4,6-dideoxygalactose transaminase